jgi:hypothetical protein
MFELVFGGCSSAVLAVAFFNIDVGLVNRLALEGERPPFRMVEDYSR